MKIEIKIPSPGESINEVELANWLVNDGDFVEKNQEVAEIESDKATLPLIADEAGEIKILVNAGESIKVGEIACTIDNSAEKPEEVGTTGKEHKEEKQDDQKQRVSSIPKESVSDKHENKDKPSRSDASRNKVKVTPLAKNMMAENDLDVEDIINGLKKISTKEVNRVIDSKSKKDAKSQSASREEKVEKMSQLRRKLSKRLVDVKNQTAMLTTFNEVDMSSVMDIRKKYQKPFQEKYGVKLGFMSFFTKAVGQALHNYPKVNSYIDGDNIIEPNYVDVGIAVQTEKGLMVPVVRNVQSLNLSEIELNIAELAQKARKFRLSIEEMTGGTFTISNGGIYGSMLSTPILNPPQSGILGMHNIIDRPVVKDGEIVVRPIMYLALSYDHRIVDGKDSVGFLKEVKEYIESPARLLLETTNPEKQLLGL